jgi:hypothetical protein
MTGIEITAAAYAALAALATRGLLEPHRSPQGGFYPGLWRSEPLARTATTRLSASPTKSLSRD